MAKNVNILEPGLSKPQICKTQVSHLDLENLATGLSKQFQPFLNTFVYVVTENNKIFQASFLPIKKIFQANHQNEPRRDPRTKDRERQGTTSSKETK